MPAEHVEWFLTDLAVCRHVTVQELLGHKNTQTTMIYTHVMQQPGVVVISPLDADLHRGRDTDKPRT